MARKVTVPYNSFPSIPEPDRSKLVRNFFELTRLIRDIAVDETLLFSYSGPVAIGIVPMPYPPTFDATILSARASAGSAPTSTLTLDFLVNGSSIFTTKPTVGVGSNVGSLVIPTTTSWEADDELEVEVESGDGGDVVLAIGFRRTS